MREDNTEFYHINFEKFHKNKIRPKGKRSLKQLIVSEKEAVNIDEPALFKDSGLQSLHESGHLNSLVGIIRSGKEATVYLGENDKGYVAVKIYADRDACLYRKKNIYSEERVVANKRFKKAIEQNSRIGRAVSHALWIKEEYDQLLYLHAKGIPVPKPIGHVGRVIMMEFIGEDGVPAPRISDLKLNKNEITLAFEQSVYNLAMMLKSDRIHGDYSTYNILWSKEKAFVIDLPQTILVSKTENFKFFLERDIQSLCSSFGQKGLKFDVNIVMENVLKIANIKKHLYS